MLEIFTFIGESREPHYSSIPQGRRARVAEIDDFDGTTYVLNCRPHGAGADVFTLVRNMIQVEITEENADQIFRENSEIIDHIGPSGHLILEKRDEANALVVGMVVMHFPDGVLMN